MGAQIDFTLSEADLADGGSMGRALSMGRLIATVVSEKTGAHVTVEATCKGKVDGKWVRQHFAGAERVFLEVPSNGYRTEIGTLHLDGKHAGKILPPWGEDFDRGRLWAAQYVLDAARGARPMVYEQASVMQGVYCFACGHELFDPESIERGLGPECAKAETASHHQKRGEAFADEGEDASAVSPQPEPVSDTASPSSADEQIRQELADASARRGATSEVAPDDAELIDVPAGADPREILKSKPGRS